MEVLVKDIILNTINDLRKNGSNEITDKNILEELVSSHLNIVSSFRIESLQLEELANDVHLIQVDLRDIYQPRKKKVIILEKAGIERFRIEMCSCMKEEVILDNIDLYSYDGDNDKIKFDQSIYTYYLLEEGDNKLAVRGKVIHQDFYAAHYDKESFEFLQNPVSLIEKSNELSEYCLNFFELFSDTKDHLKIKGLS